MIQEQDMYRLLEIHNSTLHNLMELGEQLNKRIKLIELKIDILKVILDVHESYFKELKTKEGAENGR